MFVLCYFKSTRSFRCCNSTVLSERFAMVLLVTHSPTHCMSGTKFDQVKLHSIHYLFGK